MEYKIREVVGYKSSDWSNNTSNKTIWLQKINLYLAIQMSYIDVYIEVVLL